MKAFAVDDIRPLKGPAEIKDVFPLMPVVVLLFLAAAGIAVFIYFKKRKRVETPPEPPRRSPEETAVESLNLLREMKLAEKGMVKEYYIRLSDIIRRYIENKYGILALDRTTWELYREMRTKKTDRVQADKIKDFLEECDLVKFAKYVPVPRENEERYDKALEIVKI
jgi:hypothetical protein